MAVYITGGVVRDGRLTTSTANTRGTGHQAVVRPRIAARLALGCAIVHEPPLLFLDEPTAGVDPVSRRTFWTMIYELARPGVTIFVTTHYLDEAEHVSRVAMIFDGVLRALAPPAELRQRSLHGQLLALRCARPLEALPLLRVTPGVSDVTLYGTVVHVLIDPAVQSRMTLQILLDRGGIEVESLDDMEPTIEDVFVSLIHSGRPTQGPTAPLEAG